MKESHGSQYLSRGFFFGPVLKLFYSYFPGIPLTQSPIFTTSVMFLPMTVVITASTDKNHNSVITVKDQYGQRTIDLPTPGSDANRSPDQSGEQSIDDRLTLSGPLVVSHDVTPDSDADRSADQPGEPPIDDRLTSSGRLVVSHTSTSESDADLSTG